MRSLGVYWGWAVVIIGIALSLVFLCGWDVVVVWVTLSVVLLCSKGVAVFGIDEKYAVSFLRLSKVHLAQMRYIPFFLLTSV